VGKIIMVLMAVTLFSVAGEKEALEHNCLSCHEQQQIPDTLIYKRYLMKYSTEKAMRKAILIYLKDPKKENAIMPKPFFLKFPMKKKLQLDDSILKKNIEAYLEKFSMKKKLILSAH